MKKKLVTAVLATTLLLTTVVPAQASPLLGEDSYVTLEEVTESTEEEEPPDPTETSSQEKEIERKYSPDYDINPYYNDTEEEVEEVETVTRSANIGFNNDATADADPNLQTIYNKVGNASVKTYNSYTYNAWMGTKDCTWKVNTDGVKNTASNTHKKAAEEIAKDSSYKSKWVRSDEKSFWAGSGAATPKKYKSIKNSSSTKVTDKNIEKAFLVWTTRSSKNGSLPIIFVNSDNEAYSINADNYPETPKLGSKKALVDDRVVRQDNWSDDDLNKAQPNKIFYTSYADVTDYMSGDGTYSVCNLPIYWSDYYDNGGTQRAATCGSSATDMANVNGGENLSSWSLFIVSETSDSRPHVVTIKVGSQYVLTGGSRELLTVQTKTDFGEFKTQTSSATPVAISTAFTTSGTGSNGDLLARVNFAKDNDEAKKSGNNPKDNKTSWYDPTDYALNANGGGIYGSNGNVPTDKAKGSSVSCFSVQAKDTSVWNTLRYVVTDVALEKVDIDATQTITVKERSKPVVVSGKFTNTTTKGKTGFSYGKLVVTLPKGLTVSDSNSSPVLTAHKWRTNKNSWKTYTLTGTVSTKNGQQQIIWKDKDSTAETAQVLRSVTGTSAPSEKGKRDYFEYSIDCDFNAKKGVETFRATEVLYGVKESNGSKPYGKSSFQLQSGNAKEVPKYILTVKTEGPAVSIDDGTAKTTTVTKELKPATETTGKPTTVKATGNFKNWTISDSDINKIVEYGENHDTTIDSDRFKASSSLKFYMPNKDITLTATALPKEVITATFISHSYSSSDSYNIPDSAQQKQEISKEFVDKYDPKTGKLIEKVPREMTFNFPSAGQINGWVFDGWVLSDTASSSYDDKGYNKASVNQAGASGMITKNVVYYAQYHREMSWYFVQQNKVDRHYKTVYRNSYDINRFEHEYKDKAPNQTLKEGWVSQGWTDEADCKADPDVQPGGTIIATEGQVFYGLFEKDVTVTYNTNTYDPVDKVPDPQTGKAYFSTASWDFSQVKDYVHPSYKNVLSNTWLNDFFTKKTDYSAPVDLRKDSDVGFIYPTITVADTVPVYRKINQRETDVLPTIWSTNPKGFTVDFKVTQGEWPEGFDRRINCNPQTSYEFREDTTLYQQYETLKMPADKKIHTSVSILVGDSINVGNRFKSDYFSDLGRVYVSPDHSIATVTEAGKITGRGPGVITIKVYTSDGKTDIGDCKVIVSSSSVKIPDRITLGEQAEVGITARSGEGASVTATLSMNAVSALRGRESSKLYSLHSYFGNGNDFTEVDAGNTILKAASSNGKPATDTKTFYVMPDISLQSLKSDVYDATIVWKLHLTLN
mgnify:FL=1